MLRFLPLLVPRRPSGFPPDKILVSSSLKKGTDLPGSNISLNHLGRLFRVLSQFRFLGVFWEGRTAIAFTHFFMEVVFPRKQKESHFPPYLLTVIPWPPGLAFATSLYLPRFSWVVLCFPAAPTHPLPLRADVCRGGWDYLFVAGAPSAVPHYPLSLDLSTHPMPVCGSSLQKLRETDPSGPEFLSGGPPIPPLSFMLSEVLFPLEYEESRPPLQKR